MCMSCGCMDPNDKHGNASLITLDDIERAAQASGASPEQVIRNIQRTYEQKVKK